MIPPGRWGHIQATLDTAKLKGSIGRGLTVYTDDPAAPKLFLTVRALVLGSVNVFPHESIQLSNRGVRHPRQQLLVRKEPSESGELVIEDLSPSVSWLSATAERLEQPRAPGAGLPTGQPGDWLLTVEPAGSAPFGRRRETVEFGTGLDRQPRVSIAVLVDLQPPVRISTDRLVLPQPTEGAAARETLLLTVRRGLDPSALVVEAVPESLELELEPSGQRAFKLHVGWSGSERPEGTIIFRVGTESYRLPVGPSAGDS